MMNRLKTLVILMATVATIGCGGENSVNSSQSPAPEAAQTPGQVAQSPGNSPSAAAPATPSGSGPSVAAPAPPASVAREISIPTGTKLPLELLTAVSSDTSTIEAPVRARLTKDVVVDDVVAIPSGTVLTGVVTEAERAGRVKGRSRVAFRFTEAEVRGTPERLRTESVVLVGDSSEKADAAKIGGGAVAGAVIGGLLGGGKGAAQGAAIGGGAGTGVVLSTRGEEVGLARGASVTATLAGPLTLQVPR